MRLLCWAAAGLVLRRPSKVVRRMEPEALADMEARFLRGDGPAPRLGRECAWYRWVQDEAHVYVTIPLPSLPPRNDVSLVIGPEEFACDVVFAAREIEGVRGLFAGEVAPELSRWDLLDDAVEGPSLEVVVAKKPTPAYSTMWHAFLEHEEPRPTVQFAGICAATGARFRQYADFFEVELDVLDATRPDDVRVDVAAERWTLAVRGQTRTESAGGRFRGRVLPDDTYWVLDDLSPTSLYYAAQQPDEPMKTLYITLRKEAATQGQTANWWPGLSEPPPQQEDGLLRRDLQQQQSPSSQLQDQ